MLSNLRKKLKRSWANPELNFKHLGDLGKFRILISNIQRSQRTTIDFQYSEKKPRFNAWRPSGQPIIGIAECGVVIAQRITNNGISLGFGSSEKAVPNVNQLRTGPGLEHFETVRCSGLQTRMNSLASSDSDAPILQITSPRKRGAPNSPGTIQYIRTRRQYLSSSESTLLHSRATAPSAEDNDSDGTHFAPETIQKYNSEMREVSHGILKVVLCSLGLDVTEKYSSPLFQKSQGWLRMNFYHNKSDHDNQQQPYSKAHTDIGCLTILYQDDVGGLQIRTKEGEWINTKPLPGSFVVNVGDSLQMWSNGIYRSAEHRVVYGASERLSMAFFLDFTDKAEIRAPEELTDEKHPRKYRGVTFEELKAYFMKAGPTLGGPPAYFLLDTEGI